MCLSAALEHLETVSFHREEVEVKWGHRSDNKQPLFTISPREEVREVVVVITESKQGLQQDSQHASVSPWFPGRSS